MEHGDARKQAYETFWEICNTPVLLSSRENIDTTKREESAGFTGCLRMMK